MRTSSFQKGLVRALTQLEKAHKANSAENHQMTRVDECFDVVCIWFGGLLLIRESKDVFRIQTAPAKIGNRKEVSLQATPAIAQVRFRNDA